MVVGVVTYVRRGRRQHLVVMGTMGVVWRLLRHLELNVTITIVMDLGLGLQRMRHNRECAVRYHTKSGNQHDCHSAHFDRSMSPT